VAEKKPKVSPEEAAKADASARKKIEALTLRRQAEQDAEFRRQKKSRYSLSGYDITFIFLFVAVFMACSYLFSFL
jgi:hypothetical protein